MEQESNPIIAVFGRRGKGKTTWISRYMWEHKEIKFFVYDHLRDKAFDGFYSAEVYEDIDQFLGAKEVIENSDSHIYLFRGEIEHDEFFEMCYTVGNCVCVYDEIDICTNPTYMPEHLYKIVHYGRHCNVGLIGAARRPANTSRDFTSQAESMIMFNVREQRDLKYIEDFCGKEYTDILPKLNRGQYMEYPPPDDREREIL